jgi:hypothetical protein
MLYDPGPLTLIVGAEFPIAGASSNFVGLAAEQAAALDGHAAVLVGALVTMGDDLAVNHDDEGALDLAAAAAEMDAQATASDPAIGDVAGSAVTLEGDLAGLTNDLGGQLTNADVPEEIPYPAEAYIGDSQDPDAIITIQVWYRTLLGREATGDEIMAHMRNPGGLRAVYNAIINSAEYIAGHSPQVPLTGAPPSGYHSIQYWESVGVPYSAIVDGDGNLRAGWMRTATGYERTSAPAPAPQPQPQPVPQPQPQPQPAPVVVYHDLAYWETQGIPASDILDEDGNLRGRWVRTATGYELPPE